MNKSHTQHISIQSISVILFISIAAITLLMFLLLSYEHHQTIKQREKTTEQFINLNNLANELRFAYQRYKQEWDGILIRGQDAKKYYGHLSKFYTIERQIYADIEKLEQNLTLFEKPLGNVKDFKEAFYKLGRVYRRGLQIYNETLTSPSRVADAATKVFENEPANHLRWFIENLKITRNNRYQQINSDIETTDLIILIIFSTLLLIIFSSSFLVIRKFILKPIMDATRYAKNISSGVLDEQIDTSSSASETDALLISLKIMQQNIKTAYDELRLERDRAKSSSQAKTDFLSSMSHELRTPMNAILGFTQLMKMNNEELTQEQISDYTDDILAAGNHLLRLINEVLDLSRIESGHLNIQPENINLHAILDECISQVSTGMASKMHVHIQKKSISDNLTVYADPLRVKQVLMNLLSNAVKYNNEHGSVTISAVNTAHGMVKISVQDTGNGISAENIDKLFEPFERLSQDRSVIEGSGIGLTVTKRLVELMQGNIGVDSQPGQGSTFWFELPKAAA